MTQAQTMLELDKERVRSEKAGDKDRANLLWRAECVLSHSANTSYPSRVSAQQIRDVVEALTQEVLRATTAAAQPVAWLIEWPEDDNVPVRWWNPATGWMRDANKAAWFVRESDAADYIASGKWAAVVKPTEHKFVSNVATPSPLPAPGEQS